MSNHLYHAVARLLSRKQAVQFPEWNGKYYTLDLLDDIMSDPRIADADLDLKKYKQLLSADEWEALLAAHRRELAA